MLELKVGESPEMLYEESDRSIATASPISTTFRQSAASHIVVYAIFALCATIYFMPFMRVIWKATDEGTIVYGAVRITKGQVFARDFFEVMGPGSFYILAGFFKLLGVTFIAERSWLLVTSLGTFLSMYFLSRRVCGRYQILPSTLLAGVYFSTLWPMVNHHVDSNCFALLSVVCIVLWLNLRNKGLLLAAGVLSGVTTCILQPKGMLLLLALSVWLWSQRRRDTAWPYSIALVAGSYFTVVGGTLLYFWSRGALWDLTYMNFVWPTHNYGAVNAVPYATGILQFWSHWAVPIHGVRWFLPAAVVLILPFVLVASLPMFAFALGILKRKQGLRPEILLYWLCGWGLWFSEIHRRDIAHLVAGSPLLLILCVYYLGEWRGKAADRFLEILTISAGALATINLFIVLCAHTVPTRVGRVGVFSPDPVLGFLNDHVAPGTEIFFYPYCPMYYFLSDTTNPTRYSLLIYNYNTPSQFYDVIRVLDQRKVKYVLWDAQFQAKAASTLYSSKMDTPAGGLILEPYLESHYKVVQDFNGARIMERNEDDRDAKH